MKFIFEERKRIFEYQKFFYVEEDHSFQTKPKKEEAFTSILINYLQLWIDDKGEVLYIDGLCPQINWKDEDLKLPSFKEGCLKAQIGNQVKPGIAIRLDEVGAWPIKVDRKIGWLCIGDSEIICDYCAFLSFSIAGIKDGELKAIWLKPDKLPGLHKANV